MSKNKKTEKAYENAKMLAIFATRKAMALRVGRELPHGAKKEIARLAKVSQLTVYKFFNGDLENEAIYQALTDYLVNIRAKTKKLADEAGVCMDEIYKSITLEENSK